MAMTTTATTEWHHGFSHAQSFSCIDQVHISSSFSRFLILSLLPFPLSPFLQIVPCWPTSTTYAMSNLSHYMGTRERRAQMVQTFKFLHALSCAHAFFFLFHARCCCETC
ncbi:hypothetical protein F5148DRAFT_1195834, partial [Russula earlei]